MHARKRTFWALGTAVLVLATQAVTSAPAAAVTLPFGTIRAFQTQSPSDTRSVKTFSTACPAGEKVVGGGAFTVGGIHAVITEMQPVDPPTGPDRFQVTAAADQFGIGVAWSFQVYAFCGVVPASAELEIVPRTNPPTSTRTDQAVALCPSNKRLVGAGGKIDNGTGQVDLGTVPNASAGTPSGSAAIGKEDADGFAGQYTVTAYAVCVRAPNPLDVQLERRQLRAGAGVPSQTTVLACPSGMAMTGTAGVTLFPGTHLQQLRSTVAGGRVATSGSFGAQSAVTPTEPWDMDVAVLCAR
jgi:hypothetical protein